MLKFLKKARGGPGVDGQVGHTGAFSEYPAKTYLRFK
jgi:hypothetical protein